MKDKLPPQIQALYNDVATSLNAITAVTDPKDPNYLGEPWRGHLLELKGSLNASLDSLPTIDKVPAAQEMQYGVQYLHSTLLCVQNIVNSLRAMVNGRNAETATAKASMTTEIETQVNAKLTSGEYLKKEDAQALADSARTDGETKGFAKGKLLADRRGALAIAGIPAEVVAGASDEILLGEEPAFNAARDVAKDRATKLKDLGLALNSAAMKTLPWEKEENFKSQLETFEQIKGKGQSNNSGKPPTTPPNPFVNGIPSTATETNKPVFAF